MLHSAPLLAALWLALLGAPADDTQDAKPEAPATTAGTATEEAPLRILDGRTGDPVTWEVLVRRLSRRDVVFLGEEHDSNVYHRVQADLMRDLHDARGDLVLSLEMFERDVQGILDDYLKGRVTEEVFLERSRPWKQYEDRYRAVIELARERGLDVLAANVPRPLAAAYSTSGQPFRLHPDSARRTSAPEDLYWKMFRKMMGGHMGADADDAIRGMYRAQCLKDDTMAEAITDYFRAHDHRRPLVLHLCGNFHSDYGFGIVPRVVSRDPAASVGLVTMQSVDDPATAEVLPSYLGRADFLFLLQTPESRNEEEDEDAESENDTESSDEDGEPGTDGSADG